MSAAISASSTRSPPRTKGTARTPTLLYNSLAAHPMLLPPDSLTINGASSSGMLVTVFVNNVQRGIWGYGGWGGGATYRFVPGDDGASDPNGMASYTLELRTTTGGVQTLVRTDTGHVAVINRTTTSATHGILAPGWSLAGVGYLMPEAGQPDNLAIFDGDGSSRVFYPVAGRGPTTTDPMWATPQTSRREWLTKQTLAGVPYYVQHLAHGTTVFYDVATGLQRKTVNRLGDTTAVGWSTACQTPDSLTVPYGPAPTYVFSYTAGTCQTRKLTQLTQYTVSGASRVVAFTRSTNGDTLKVTDPDGKTVRYGYDAAHRITRRVNQLGDTTAYTYNNGGKLTQVRQSMRGAASITATFVPAETKGLGWVSGELPLASAYTELDGPRTDVADVTQVWIDRFGAPTKIQDALAHVTTIQRSATWPALTASITYPNARVVSATYDDYGHLTTQTDQHPFDDARTATTIYEWDPTWDEVTRVVLPDTQTTWFGYDPVRGNRLWQQPSQTLADQSRRVTFNYQSSAGGPSGPALWLLSSTQLPGTAKDSVEYDVRGNVAGMRTPLGFWTRVIHDRFGRDSVVRTPIDVAGSFVKSDSTLYDAMDRPTLAAAYAPAIGTAAAQRLQVTSVYDSVGQLLQIDRASMPDPTGTIGTITTRYRYDAVGRQVAEVEGATGLVDSTAYDPAGNAVLHRSRRGKNVTRQYDVLNHVTDRWLDTVTYAQRSAGLALLSNYHQTDIPPSGQPNPLNKQKEYPHYPNNGSGGYTIVGDHETFTYNPTMGWLTQANNADAQVGRTYYPNGQLKTETQVLRGVNATNFLTNAHTYTLTYNYDRNGRRTSLVHPTALTPFGVAGNGDQYRYDTVTGALDTVVDVLGNQFRYGYTLRGDPDTLIATNAFKEIRRHDDDGRLVEHKAFYCSASPCSNFTTARRSTTLSYDARGLLASSTDLAGWQEHQTASYSGLGQLVSSGYTWLAQGTTYSTTEDFTSDALGNVTHSSSGSTFSFTSWSATTRRQNAVPRDWHYESGTGRHLTTDIHDPNVPYQTDQYTYDLAGNIEWSTQAPAPGPGARLEDRASYYAADGQLKAADFRTMDFQGNGADNPTKSTFEAYRYDALGRRILVRARSWCDDQTTNMVGSCRMSLVRRTVWDGDAELYEIQMPADDPDTDATMENDTAPTPRRPLGGVLFWDASPYFGRVAYAHGLATDQPLSITRLGYVDWKDGATQRAFAPFSLLPFWSARGLMDFAVYGGGTADPSLTGRLENCVVESTGQRCASPDNCQASGVRCVIVDIPGSWFAYERQKFTPQYWQGTITVDKQDRAGTLYRRNRQYDPITGRFTQEDPAGLAGGLNLYGFGNGDPVNYSDPFGLCPSPPCAEDMLAAFQRTGQLLEPAQLPLEIAGSIVTAPLAGGMGMMGASAVRC